MNSHIVVDAEVKRRLQKLAADRQTSMKALVQEAIRKTYGITPEEKC